MPKKHFLQSIPLKQLNVPSRKMPIDIQEIITEFLDAKSLSNAKSCDFFSRFYNDEHWKSLVTNDITTQPILGSNENYKAFYKRANHLLITIKKAIATPNTIQDIFNNLFGEVVESGYEKFVHLLIDIVDLSATRTGKDEADYTFLHSAARIGNAHFVRILLEKEAPVDPVDAGRCIGGYGGGELVRGWGITPLFRAARNGHSECVKLLLAYGANPNFKSAGDTYVYPLSAAAENGHVECVRFLLAGGAHVVPPNAFNSELPLIRAENKNHDECADLIRDHMRSLGLPIPTNTSCVVS